MSTTQQPRSLPDNPSLENLRKQAKDLVKSRKDAGEKLALKDAQREVAVSYGFKTWAELKAQLESLDRAGQLKAAIDREDVEAVRRLLKEDPSLHRAKMGYGNNGPLTWVAECRGSSANEKRLAMAKLMIEMGSDVHQGGDGPLMRATLGSRLPMAELLVAHGADVNALWSGHYPIVMGPCECLCPASLKWLLDRGADPSKESSKYGLPLDVAIGTYGRNPKAQHECVELLYNAGAPGKFRDAPSIEIHRGRLDLLAKKLDADPGLLSRQFPELAYGGTAHRGLDLKGATLLHVAAEFCDVEALKFLLARGADPNVKASVDANGVGGQTPLFHAVTQYHDGGLECARLLIEAGADVSLQVKIQGHHEATDQKLTVTPLGYAARFPYGNLRTNGAVELLKQHKARAGDLYAAARAGYLEEARELIASGADLNVKGCDDESPIGIALLCGHPQIAELLAKAGADVSLVDACRLGLVEKVAVILKADPEKVRQETGDRSWTPLFFAAAANQVPVLDVLKKHRAAVNARDTWQKRTPLHRAIEARADDAVEWLLEQGAEVNAGDFTGTTPLHVAAATGASLRVVDLLLEHRADPAIATGGKTPLDMAIAGKHDKIAERLRKLGG